MQLTNGTQIDLEIQIVPFPNWTERSLFYLAKMYTDQIKEGEPYEVLKKCIQISILDFILFPETEAFYSSYHLWEDGRHELYTDKFEVHVLELPKLARYDYPQSELLNWARFINAETKEEFERVAKTNPYIGRAYEELERISADEEKRLEYEARQKAIRDHNHLMKVNLEAGCRQGLEEGRAEGKAEAIMELLSDCGEIPAALRSRIMEEKDMEILKKWLKLAARAASVEEFSQKLENE